MAQDIELQGAQYSDVPAVELPKVGGGTASFTDVTDTTATAADVMSGAYFYTAAGVRSAGTLNFPVTSVNGMTGAVQTYASIASIADLINAANNYGVAVPFLFHADYTTMTALGGTEASGGGIARLVAASGRLDYLIFQGSSAGSGEGAVVGRIDTAAGTVTSYKRLLTVNDTAVTTGNWTPTISRSGGVTKTSATYIKTGHTVHLAATITVTAGTVSSAAYFDASCLPFTPSSSGAVFGTMSNTSSHASYSVMANPGVNNNMWICGSSGGIAANALSGTFAVHLTYITNS